jgi:hypothetical protein
MIPLDPIDNRVNRNINLNKTAVPLGYRGRSEQKKSGQ